MTAQEPTGGPLSDADAETVHGDPVAAVRASHAFRNVDGFTRSAADRDITTLLGVIDELNEQIESLRRGGRELGRIVDRQCIDVLDATGMHGIIGADGDGDWALVWERLALLRPRAERASAALARVKALDTGYREGGGNAHAYCISPVALRKALADPAGAQP